MCVCVCVCVCMCVCVCVYIYIYVWLFVCNLVGILKIIAVQKAHGMECFMRMKTVCFCMIIFHEMNRNINVICLHTQSFVELMFCILASNTFWMIQINHQLDATISPVFYLTFIYSSTCFGRPHVHHWELNNCSSSLWFYLRSVVITVLLFVVGPACRPVRPRTTALLSPRSEGKIRACYCSC